MSANFLIPSTSSDWLPKTYISGFKSRWAHIKFGFAKYTLRGVPEFFLARFGPKLTNLNYPRTPKKAILALRGTPQNGLFGGPQII